MKIVFVKTDSYMKYRGISVEDQPVKNGVRHKYELVVDEETGKEEWRESKKSSEKELEQSQTQPKTLVKGKQESHKFKTLVKGKQGSQKSKPYTVVGEYSPDYIFEPVELEGFGKPMLALPLKSISHVGNVDFRLAYDSCGGQGKVEDVLIIWCAARDNKCLSVVGWNGGAVVRKTTTVVSYGKQERKCKGFADPEQSYLLPYQVRGLLQWRLPQISVDGYGFGPSMTFNPEEERMAKWLEQLFISMGVHKELVKKLQPGSQQQQPVESVPQWHCVNRPEPPRQAAVVVEAPLSQQELDDKIIEYYRNSLR